jgi:RNA recognition motif-containing protein
MMLHIDNLPFGISKTELLNLFKEFGEVVNANLVNDRYMRRSKGFAFVEMDSRSNGQLAMESLNKTVYKNKPLVCKVAHLKQNRNGRR